MKKVATFTPQLTSPRWMGDYGSRTVLLPGGALVNDAKFTADAFGIKQILSGTLLGKRSGAYLWEPVINAKTTDLTVLLTANVAIGASILPVANVSGYKVGDAVTLTAGGTTETKVVLTVNRLTNVITLSAPTTNAYTTALAGNVKLTTAIAQDEFYLLAYDIEDAVKNAEVPALYRRDGLVRFNMLPGFPFTGLAAVEATIRTMYECVSAI